MGTPRCNILWLGIALFSAFLAGEQVFSQPTLPALAARQEKSLDTLVNPSGAPVPNEAKKAGEASEAKDANDFDGPQPWYGPTELPGILAVATRTHGLTAGAHEPVGAFRFSHSELDGAISSLGDPSRVVQTLPGVGRPSDWLTTLIVRGGAADQNAYLLDAMPALKVSHYEESRGGNGGVGMVNLAFLDELSFHNGAFAARYPDKLSSVVKLKFRDGNTEQHSGRFTADVTGVGGVVEGPVAMGERTGSYASTFRYSTMALLLDAGIVDAFGVPTYYNGHVKLYAPFHRGELRLNALGGEDVWLNKILLGRGDIHHAMLNYSGWTGALGGEWKQESRFGQSEVALYYSQRTQDAEFFFTDRNGRRMADSLGHEEHARDERVSLSIDHGFNPHPRLAVRVGGLEEFLLRDYHLDYANQKTYLPRRDTVMVYSEGQRVISPWHSHTAVYGEATLSLDAWNFYAGYRHLYEEYTDNHGFGPRLGAKFHFGPDQAHAFKGAFGRHTQAHSFADLALRDNPHVAELPYNWQTVAGYEWQAPQGVLLSLEAFDKQAFRLPRQRFFLEGERYRSTFVDTGRTSSRGFEIYAKKSKLQRFSGSATYSYLWHREANVEGRELPTQFSVPHRFNVAVGYDLLANLTFSARYSFASGQPYVPFDSTLSYRMGTGVYDYQEAYQVSEPHFARLDLRMEYHHFFEQMEMRTFTEVANVMNRPNRFERIWDPLDGGDMNFPGMGLLPMAGVTLVF